MNNFDWRDLPEIPQSQIRMLGLDILFYLMKNLRGVYIHGSLAMDCFNPDRSDIDLLVVTHNGMSRTAKKGIAKVLLKWSNKPHPIEISFLHTSNITPWQYPTPFDFHYSEGWREQTTQDVAGDGWREWNKVERRDPDLAAHITITLARGITVFGPSPQEVFPAVPAWDYVDSIWRDVEEANDWIDTNVVYGTLNLCRVYAFVRDGLVCSKDEGGVWALKVVPPQFQPLVGEALMAYRGEVTDDMIDQRETTAFVRFMLDEIARYKGEL